MFIDFLRQVLSFAPVVAALLLVRVVNMPRVSRVRQYPMPVVALIYAVTVLIALHTLNSSIDSILRAVFDFLPFLRGMYETTWQYVIENVAVLLIFAAVKFVLVRLFARLFQGDDFIGSSLVEYVYDYDSERSAWFIRPHNAMLRVYLRVLFWGSVGITIVLTALIVLYPTWPGFIAIPFPVVAALVIGEVFYAIDGLTREEYTRDIAGEDDSARRVVGYSRLRDVLTETFPGRAIDDGTVFASSDAHQSHGKLDELTRSDDDVDRLAGEYFARLKAAGAVLDTNLINAAADLMRGRSTLIGNPFYGDLTEYLVFPAYFHLLQYRKCLIVCGRDSIATDLASWVEEGLESITGVPGLWTVGQLGDSQETAPDVGILRFADIHNLDLIRANEEFFRDVHYVIIAEPSRLLATGQIGLSIVLGRCGNGAAPVYAAFDRNHDGLVDTLSHLLKVDLTDVVAAGLPQGRSTEIVWDADGEPMHGGVLPAITRYLGMGTEIAAVALKYQVAEIDWMGSERFPVNDMMWIAGQYYGAINEFADLDISQHALAEAVHPRSNPWDIEPREHRFLVVEDEIRNVYESIRLYATRAFEDGFVNLLSEDYLLRDYMVANRRIFAADPKAVPSIVPDYARTERNAMMRLLLVLLTFGMSESELARELELIGWALPPVESPIPGDSDEGDAPAIAILRELLQTHAGLDDVAVEKTLVADGRWKDGRPRWERRYAIIPDAALNAIVQALHSAYFFVEDEAEEHNYLGAVLYGLVHQVLLPGQFVTYAGKYYQVQSIGNDVRRSGIVLRRAAEHIRDRRVYRALRTFALHDRRVSERVGAQIITGEISLTRVFATIEVNAHGYFESPTRSDLVNGREVLISGLPTRLHTHKELLEIMLPGVAASVRRTLAVLLNELFLTVFPQDHPYIVALTADPERSFGPLLQDLDAEDDDVIFIVEDSPLDMGLLVAVERNWRRLFAVITDYLEWQSTPEAPDEDEPRAQGVAVFPGESREDAERRASIAADQDASPAPPLAPRRAPWWRRLARWVRGILPQRKQVAPVPVPPPADDMGPVDHTAGPVSVDVPDVPVESDVPDVVDDAATTAENERENHVE